MLVNLAAIGKDRKGSGEPAGQREHHGPTRNTIPNDPQSAFVTSGLRLGSPAVTSRGMNEQDMDLIAETISMMLKDPEANAEAAKANVRSLDGEISADVGKCWMSSRAEEK